MKHTQMTITYPGGHQEIEYIAHADPGGVFGPIFRRRREERVRKARAQRDSRLLQLSRDIEALEAWHHAWRLEWDVDYRELHPGEWCERHGEVRKAIYCGRYYSCQTLGSISPHRRSVVAVPVSLTTEERRAATRTMAKWGRAQ